jgi:hypothetical protein
MELVHCTEVIGVLCGFPGWFVITRPLDKIPQSATYSFGVQDLIHLILLFAINFDRRWGRKVLAWIGVLIGK